MPVPQLAIAPAHPQRVVFLGTPTAAVPSLRALVADGFDVALVITRADRRRGRRSAPTPTPVKAAALELGIRVSHDLDDVVTVGADLAVVVAYGRLVPTRILESLAFLNVHFSLLPRWRGAAPVERAILAGDDTTGVCIMGLEPALDTGPVYSRAETPIDSKTADELTTELADLGASLLVRTMRTGLADPVPQSGEVTFADKLGPQDRFLDWNRPANELERVVRIGGAWTTWRGKRLLVHRAQLADSPDLGATAPGGLVGVTVATGAGGLELMEVQPEGKGRTPARAWLNGARPGPDDRLGS